MKTYEQFNEIDSFGEEDWTEIQTDYTNYKGNLFQFIEQFNDDMLNGFLDLIKDEKFMKTDNFGLLFDIIYTLNKKGVDYNSLRRISKEIINNYYNY